MYCKLSAFFYKQKRQCIYLIILKISFFCQQFSGLIRISRSVMQHSFNVVVRSLMLQAASIAMPLCAVTFIINSLLGSWHYFPALLFISIFTYQ